MSEERVRIIAEDLMLAFSRPCLTPIGVKLLTGGITQHCCWDCHNCKTAEKQARVILSELQAKILAAVGVKRLGYEAYYDRVKTQEERLKIAEGLAVFNMLESAIREVTG